MRTLTVSFALGLLAILPFAATAAPEVAVVEVEPVVLTQATTEPYAHLDCVGPGLPGTAAPHATHTERVDGFVLDPARPIRFSLTTLSPFGAGICPTSFGGPVLEADFTGTWKVTAVCRNALNDGAVAITWSVGALAGLPLFQASSGVGCQDYLGDPFSYDLTIEISAVKFAGLTLPPVGGVGFDVGQA